MMNSQLYVDRPLSLASHAGEIVVASGSVWLTRRGDLDDHVLEAGQRVSLSSDDAAVVEPWRAGEHTVIDWQPAAQPRVLRRLVGGLAALARSAASMARRARGRM